MNKISSYTLRPWSAADAAGFRKAVDESLCAIVGGATLHKRIGPGGRDIGYWLRTSSTGKDS